MTRALVVTDVQNDFCEGGSLAVRGGAQVAFRIGELLRHWQDAEPEDREYDFVVASRDHHIDPGSHFSEHPNYIDSWPVHCVVGTDGAAFHPNLDPQPFHAIFLKGEYAAAYSSFEGIAQDGSPLSDWLKSHGVSDLDIVGLTTDHCVLTTAVDARRESFHTRVLLEMTAGVRLDTTQRALETMRSAGVELVGSPVLHG